LKALPILEFYNVTKRIFVSEAGMYSMLRGFLNLEVAGRTAGEVKRLKLMADPDIFRQPGAAWERIGHRFRGLLGSLLADSVISASALEELLDAESDKRARDDAGLDQNLFLEVDDGGGVGGFLSNAVGVVVDHKEAIIGAVAGAAAGAAAGPAGILIGAGAGGLAGELADDATDD
jgi:hypothetical protein